LKNVDLPSRSPLPLLVLVALASSLGGCTAAAEASLDITIFAVLFGGPLLLLQMLTLIVAAVRRPRPPELSLFLGVFFAVGAVLLGIAGLVRLADVPADVRGQVGGALALLIVMTTPTIWGAVGLVGMRLSTPVVDADGDLLPRQAPGGALLAWALLYPLAMGIVSGVMCLG
jgi:hypothetical protein